jgi:hypothetical protein
MRRLRYWFATKKAAWAARWRRWRAPKYPKVVMDWGPDAPLMGRGWRTGGTRDCGHLSPSYAFDPLREETMCLECYRQTVSRSRPRSAIWS